MKRRIGNATLTHWREVANAKMAEYKQTRFDVQTGAQAWQLLGAMDVLGDLYHADPTITDFYIEAALRKVFPNAIFKEETRY